MRYRDCPPEVRQLGRTMQRWRTQIAAWHQAQVSNGPTETMNALAKRIKRVAISASATSCTGASACCSTPASPTGPSCPRSPHDPAQIRRAWKPRLGASNKPRVNYGASFTGPASKKFRRTAPTGKGPKSARKAKH